MHTNRWENIHAYLFEPKKKYSKPACVLDLGLSIQPITSQHIFHFEEQRTSFKNMTLSELMKLHNRRAFFPKIFWETILPDPLQANSLASCVYFTFSTSCIRRGYMWRLQFFGRHLLQCLKGSIMQCSTDFHSNIQFLLKKVHLSPMIKINAIIMK